jgi:hypothetical protein
MAIGESWAKFANFSSDCLACSRALTRASVASCDLFCALISIMLAPMPMTFFLSSNTGTQAERVHCGMPLVPGRGFHRISNVTGIPCASVFQTLIILSRSSGYIDSMNAYSVAPASPLGYELHVVSKAQYLIPVYRPEPIESFVRV